MFDLTCVLTTTGSEVVVKYHGVNGTKEPVFVAHLPVDAASKQYPNSAYTALSNDGQRLDLILGASPLPYDRDVEFGVSALFVKLQPGEQLAGEIHLPIPVDEWNAYDLTFAGMESEPVTVGQLLFTVDVIPESKSTRVQAAKEPAGHWYVVGPVTQSKCVMKAETPIRVRRRSDDFPRAD